MRPYVVREFSLGTAVRAAWVVAFAVAWVLCALLTRDSVPLAALGVVSAGYVMVTRVVPAPVLRVDPQGVRVGGVQVPWASLRQVVITVRDVVPAGQPVPVEVGARLAHGAPLPTGMRSVIYDPNDPDPVRVARVFRPGQVDPEALAGALAAFGPVEVVHARGGQERRM